VVKKIYTDIEKLSSNLLSHAKLENVFSLPVWNFYKESVIGSLFVGCGRRRERCGREDRCGWKKKSRRQLRMQDAHERASEMKEQVRIIPRSSDQMLYV